MKTGHLLTAGESAKAVGISTAAISKAIKSGRLPYVEKTNNGYLIDPSVLFHVFRHRQFPSTKPENEPGEPSMDVTPEVIALRVANVRLESELASLRALLHSERQRAEAAERDRDAWRKMSDHLVSAR